MADHVAKQIRDRIKSTCTSLTTTGSNVYASRVYPHESANLPSLNIVVGPEAIELEQQSMGNATYLRQVQMAIECRAATTSDIDATLLTIQKEVEVAMAGDEDINGLAKSSWLTQVDQSELSGEADKQVGLRTLIYTVFYETGTTTPDQVAT